MRTRKIVSGWPRLILIVRFRRLAQVLGIRTVVHDSEMHVRPPGLFVVHLMMAKSSSSAIRAPALG